MNNAYTMALQALPDLIERQCGGWLAVSPSNLPIRIGATGQTKKDVIARYTLAMQKWIDTLSDIEDEQESQTKDKAEETPQ